MKTEESVKKEDYWFRFAEDFDERSFYVIGEADLNAVQNRLAKQKNLGCVLELGCGNGMYTRTIAKQASKLYATDFANEMVEVSRQKLADLPNVTVDQADCRAVPYEDGMFDTVFMANVLHIVPEPQKAAAEAFRVVKPGGSIIVVSYTTDGMTFFGKLGMVYRYLKTWGKPSPHARTLLLNGACRMLTDTGFQIENAELVGSRSKALFVTATKQ